MTKPSPYPAAPENTLWYGPGSTADSIWFFNADKTHSTTSRSVGGSYAPIVGDFDGGGIDDIFWYGPGSAGDSIWYFKADKSNTSAAVDVGGSYIARSGGDFNRDGIDDVLWFAPGTAAAPVWLMFSGSATETRYDGNGVPIVGDFNGDNLADIFWYE